jgi:hypothetical protein
VFDMCRLVEQIYQSGCAAIMIIFLGYLRWGLVGKEHDCTGFHFAVLPHSSLLAIQEGNSWITPPSPLTQCRWILNFCWLVRHSRSQPD